MKNRLCAVWILVLSAAATANARPPVLPTVGTPPGTAPLPATQEIAGSAVDRAGLLPEDLALLDDPRYRWQHLQTAHFVLHHDQ